MTDHTNVTAMPGVTLPTHHDDAVPVPEPIAVDPNFIATLEDLLRLAKEGKIRWVAATGQFDNGQKMSLFGNMSLADPTYVVGAVRLLEHEYMDALRISMAS